MDLLKRGSIAKLLSGAILDLPVILLIEEASVLFVEGDQGAESGMANVRLRLSDSIESFSGFVCKTKLANDLIPGTFISIESFQLESLGENKLLCKIGDMNIIYDNHNSAVSRTDYLEGMANRVCTNDCAAQDKLVLIGLAAVDLSAGRNNSVRGRVVSKSFVKTYDLDQHKFFYFDMMDDSGALRVKAFDQQCDRTFPRVNVGEMIELSKFYVSVANKKYSQLSSDYDIIVQNYTELIILRNFAPITIQPTFQFHSLHQMEQLKIDSLYDAIGIIKSVGALSIVHEKATLKQLSIVRLLLCDSTGNMEVNLWNDIAASFVGKKNDILAVKGFRLSVYHKKFILNSVMGSGIFLNPSCDEADQLRSLIISSALGHDE